ncbi:DExH-box ATP-dependent RNA helicase DExH6-like [Amaranthus tricolor]|uniref:DExH-box ATP-dependent RNA helicase DExH6-like n=1 Tax=Amaranthus tricolor TaxID=29722 RepID=UPI00258E8AB4|nr:DExH-box ATP-dependent RNA helicase DExH6-like [Amaranthus tricolor]
MTTKSKTALKKEQSYHRMKNKHTENVSEATRINISKAIRDFRASNDQVYTFEANLTNCQRAAVHHKCRKMGLISKSAGKGDNRRVSVYKSKKKSDCLHNKKKTDCLHNKKKSDCLLNRENQNPVITFSEASKRVLMDLFIRHPPSEDEVGNQKFNEPTSKTPDSHARHRNDSIFRIPLMKEAEIAKNMELLASKIKSNSKLKEISVKRTKLPIAMFKDTITSTIATHQVVLISGETGCGKTTQVPQYLLDYMWAGGKACKIVCAQPRRISAISVAERISSERGENIGESVGYKIRLETKGGRHSSILFCTNGVLLRLLVSGASNGSKSRATNFSEITHIIVDEIHERDRYSDFMLAVLRDLLPNYPNLRLVLMSATLDAERFSQYFGGCPIIRVPGFTHPVKAFYLEDILSILISKKNHLNYASLDNSNEVDGRMSEESCVALDEAINMASSNEDFDPLLKLISSAGTSKVLNYQNSSTGVTPLMVFAGKGRVGDICTLLSLGADCHLKAHDGSTALDWAKREHQPEAEEILMKYMVDNSPNLVEEQQLVEDYISTTNPEFIDVVIIKKLLSKICMESEKGAILIFLPGWEEINRTRECLLADPFFNDSSKFRIITLHSMVPAAEQKLVFKLPPRGCRKIILSTNIAETSITIDDVVYVLDSGRLKEKNYDPYNNVSTLQSSWTSKASAKQREGRAGRCQPGVCYHFYSKLRAVSLPEFQVPEIKRMPIEELCLQVKLIDSSCKIQEFLKKTLDPPVPETIKNAVTILQEIGALSPNEQLTELGKKLASLPVHPLTSRMLFLAILLNCLDPALTLACAADYKDPFILPPSPDIRKRAIQAKQEIASLYGGQSDQLTLLAAFDCWRSARERNLEAWFCKTYYVSSTTMRMLSGMRIQLLNELIRTGCVSDDVSKCSKNAKEPGIIRAILVAGMYPKVGRLHPPSRNRKKLIVETSEGDKVFLHSQSIASKIHIEKPDEPPLLVYDEVTRGDMGLHTRNCTIINPLPLILLAKEIVVAPVSTRDNGEDPDDSGSDAAGIEDMDVEMEDSNKMDKKGEKVMSSPKNVVTLIVDHWLPYKCTALEVAQIYCLRERLSAAILFKVSNPREVLPPALGLSIYAIACLFAYDGMKGINSPFSESVETLTSMVDNTEIDNSSSVKKDVYQAPTPSGPLLSLFYDEMSVRPLHDVPSPLQGSFEPGEEQNSMPMAGVGAPAVTGQDLPQLRYVPCEPTPGAPVPCETTKVSAKKRRRANKGVKKDILEGNP